MPDATPEIVYTGAGKPPSWGERAGQFVKEKIIDPHTPEAHYQKIMKRYFWATDRLEGRPRDIAQRIRPQVELAAKAAGWSETFAELYLAGSAITITAILAGKGLKTAAEVFGGMARRHGGKKTGEEVLLLAAGSPAASAVLVVPIDVVDDKPPLDIIHKAEAPADRDESDYKLKKRKRLPAKARRDNARRRGGIPVAMDDTPRTGRAESHSVAALDGNGRELTDDIRQSAPPPEIPMDRWDTAYDKAIGTDTHVVTQKIGTLGLLKSMMMDSNPGGFSEALAAAMAESNGEIRKNMVNTTVEEAAQAFGVDAEAALAAQLLIEYITSQEKL